MTVIGDTPDWINPQAGLNFQTPLLNGVVIGSGLLSAVLDLTPYSSVLIYSPVASTAGFNLDVFDVDSGFVLTTLTTPPDGLGLQLPPIVIPVKTRAIQLINQSLDPATMHVIGTSIKPLHEFSGQSLPDVQDMSLPSQALAGTIDLGFGAAGGPVYSSLRMSNANAKGIFQVASGPNTMFIADTNGGHTDPGGGVVSYVNWIAPAGMWKFQYFSVVNATASIKVGHIYAG